MGITFVLREGDLCYYAEEDAISPLWKGRRFPMSACISGWCMSQRAAAVIEDIREDPRIPQDAYRQTFVRSLAMVPVRQDDPLAAVGAYWSEVRDVSQREVDLLQSIANAAALALTKVELEQEREKVRKAQRELSHRLRNVLTVVQSVAHQSLKSVATIQEFEGVFNGRLGALAGAQMLLVGSGESGADLSSLIREQLMIDQDERRIFCSGPDVFLAADEAFDLGLALYELGTNARKYGALSRETGRVTIKWDSALEENRRIAALTWTEEGGPPVTAPRSTGFGSALLRNAFQKNGGEVEVNHDPKGVICVMRIPLP